MKYIGIRTQNEPRIYRDPTETKSGGYEIMVGKVKVKYRPEEVSVFDNPTDAIEWFYAALDERCEGLENRIVHIRREAAKEIARLQAEEFEALKAG